MIKKIIKLLKNKKVVIAALTISMAACSVILCSAIGSLKPTNESDDLAAGAGDSESRYNILLLGVDKSERLSDVIMLVSFNAAEGSASVVQIPRDTYAEYTSAAYRKMNGALSSLGGGREVAEFLERVFDITVDYYVTVDIEAIERAVDRLGGVEVNISEDMQYEDAYQGLSIDLRAGRHLLDGEMAMQFIRYRSGYVRGDIARLDAQKIFLSALLERLSSSGFAELVRVAQGLISDSKSDIPLSECLKLVSNATKIDGRSVRLITLPGADVKTDGGSWYYIINKKETHRILCEYFGCESEYSELDPNRLLTGTYSREFNSIYDAESGYESLIYTADEINAQGIKIEKIN